MKKMRFFEYDIQVYGLDSQSIALPGSEASVLSCALPPGQQSEGHNHYEREMFLFVSGNGRVTAGKSAVPVGPGDAVYFEGFENHIIENHSATETMKIISIYWPAAGGLPHQPERSPSSENETLIFSTPPTPNGDLHLGHLAGPYLTGDILKRALEIRGTRAVHVSGRDDHQTYVGIKAMKKGMDYTSVADYFAEQIQETWKHASIEMDDLIIPDRTGPYADFVREGIRRLYDLGYIVEKEELAAIERNGSYLHEGYIRGRCPHCEAPCDGNACEECGRPNACVDMLDPAATLSGEQMTTAPVSRLYFRLSAFTEHLAQYVRMADVPSRVARLGLDMIADGLPDICVSHPNAWGIAHDISGFQDQCVYVWFEMAFGYLWAGGRALYGDNSDPWDRAQAAYDGKREIVHAYGFDNAYYHLLLFPAVYEALGLSPPMIHIVNELLELEGQKFSTSRGHLIWAGDLLAELPADYVRFGLARCRPEGTRVSFSLASETMALNNLFAGDLVSWIDELRAAAVDGFVPEPGAWLADQKAFYKRIGLHAATLESALVTATFSPASASRSLAELIREGARFAAAQRPLVTGQVATGDNYRRTAVALSARGLGMVAHFGRPLFPTIVGQLRDLLCMGENELSDVPDFFPPGHCLDLRVTVDLPRAHPQSLAEQGGNETVSCVS